VYRRVFREVVEPAADRFRPDFVVVSCGLDAGYQDPSARLALHSADFGWMAAAMVAIAARHADGRLLMTHEGGYALHFMPICFLRIVEALADVHTGLDDPFLAAWGDDFAAAVPVEAEPVIDACAALAAQVPAND
jgi:acetoin utilization deacetylase AcuC-like enzyme